MLLDGVLLVLGLAALILGADWLVDGASVLARRLGVSSLVVGLTIVSFGTSLPELVVSVLAAVQGNAQVSLGNIVGSNISNILLVLGCTALVGGRIAVRSSTVRKEIPFAILAAAALLVLAQNAVLGWVEGAVLLLFFSVFSYYAYELMIASASAPAVPGPGRIPAWRAWALVVVGAGVLWLGGRTSVDAAVSLARGFGLSEYLISATVVAVGTSLPELVASVTAAFKGEVDLAVGNVIGSNVFNTFWVIGLTALIAPLGVPAFLTFDLLVSLGAALLLFAVVVAGSRRRLVRAEGAVFVLLYVAYVAALVWRG